MAANHKYTPFLKFKANEVAGLSMLSDELKAQLTPFFDLPRKDSMTLASLEATAAACRKKADKYLGDFPYIFVDSFDIPDSIAASLIWFIRPLCRK